MEREVSGRERGEKRGGERTHEENHLRSRTVKVDEEQRSDQRTGTKESFVFKLTLRSFKKDWLSSPVSELNTSNPA